MIVKGVQRHAAVQGPAANDGQAVRQLLHRYTQRRQHGGHRVEPVALLAAQERAAGEPGGLGPHGRQQRQRRQQIRRLGYVHRSRQLLQIIGNGPVGLAAAGRQIRHGHAAALQRVHHQPPAARRPVALHRGLIGLKDLWRGNAPARFRGLHGHAVPPQGIQRHVHIGAGHQRRGQHKLRRLRQQRQRHQQAADGLGSLVSPQGIAPRRQRLGDAVAILLPRYGIGCGQGPFQQPGRSGESQAGAPQRHRQRQQKPQRRAGRAAVDGVAALPQDPQPGQRGARVRPGQCLRQRLSRQKAADQLPVPRTFAGRRGHCARQAGRIQPPGHARPSRSAASGTSST